MTIRKILIPLCVCLLGCLPLQALSIAVSDAAGEKGQVVDVSVSVTGFTTVVGMQFSINWDSTALSFQSIENLTEQLPQFSDKEIGLVGASSGAIRVAWIDNSTNGVSLPDNAVLFHLKFELIGDIGSTNGVMITGNPISIEFSGPDGNVLEIEELVEGQITIPDPSTSIDYVESTNGTQLFQNEPNPFKTSTKITLTFSKVEQITFFITDALGKVVYKERLRPIQGENTIEIRRSTLPTPGTYYYTLQSEHYQLSKKMILLP